MSCAARDDRLAFAEANLAHQGTKLLRARAGVIAGRARRLVGITVPAHVGHEDSVTGFGQSGHHFAPLLAGAEEAVPEQYWRAGRVATEQIMNAHPAAVGRFACETWD